MGLVRHVSMRRELQRRLYGAKCRKYGKRGVDRGGAGREMECAWQAWAVRQRWYS